VAAKAAGRQNDDSRSARMGRRMRGIKHEPPPNGNSGGTN
jgi:hypothetical protein